MLFMQRLLLSYRPLITRGIHTITVEPEVQPSEAKKLLIHLYTILSAGNMYAIVLKNITYISKKYKKRKMKTKLVGHD